MRAPCLFGCFAHEQIRDIGYQMFEYLFRQILQSKISRLEHLLQLKDLRIEDLDMKLKAALGGRPMR